MAVRLHRKRMVPRRVGPPLATIAALTAFAVAPAPALAQELAPITDRDYALDLYSGSVVGSVRMIGMGGASVGFAEGSVGTLSNAAAAAVRRTTKSGDFAWDFHLDAQSAAFASDFDNNGLEDTDDFSSVIGTLGLVIQYKQWGVGVVATTTSTRIVEDDGDDATVDGVLEPKAIVGKVVIARASRDEAHTFGGGLRWGSLAMTRPSPGLDDIQMFSVSSPGIEAGYMWRPVEAKYRLGADAGMPISGGTIGLESCDPLDCEGYILPERVEVPWVVAGGGAYRLARTPWNKRVETKYRDELSLLVAGDLVITGWVADGHGVEAFARHTLQRSGLNIAVSPRLGTEAELIPGWLRLRVGSYWEPSRFRGVDGRLHGTAGADLRLFGFHLFGSEYRLKVSLTADRAPRYGNTGLSIGFWH
jgi:hypothetical protein